MQARVERGLSQAEVAAKLNQTPIDPERCLRRIAALSVLAGSIRRQKGLTRKQVAERGNLSIEFVRDMEAGKIFNPEVYLVYCLSYGLRLSYSKFEGKVDRLSRIELDENDVPVRRSRKRAEEDTTKPPAASLRAQQSRFDNFRYVFNNERPHEGLNNQVQQVSTTQAPSDYRANCRSSRTRRVSFCDG
jgi:transcriptional regulator with XRE-family HTH domain